MKIKHKQNRPIEKQISDSKNKGNFAKKKEMDMLGSRKKQS